MKFAYKTFLMVFAVLIISSCSKKFLDVNTNPNAPVDVPPKTLLPTATVGLAFSNGNELGKAAGLLMQYNATTNINAVSGAYDTWNVSGFDGQWTNELYVSVLNNLGIIVQKTQGRSPAYSGIAKLEMAYAFAMMTDLWGDIPYSQAAQGLDAAGFPKFPQPRFDAQMDIYLGNSSKGIKSLFNLVREGLGDIASAPPFRAGVDPAGDDMVYGGNLNRWTRFGNSLLLKLALQVSNRAPDTTTAVINSVLAGKPFIDAVDGSLDFNVPFTANNPNPYYLQNFGGSIAGTEMLSNRFLNLERSLNDSLRLSRIYTKPAATFVGVENGSAAAPPPLATQSAYGAYIVGPSGLGEAPIRLMTAFRNFFILAESALRFGTTGDPNAYYQMGITASMKSVGLTDAQITAYFTANPTIVNLSGTPTQKLQQIITQKYIASVGNAVESYNDYRRTGYPVLQRPLQTFGDDPNTFPQRFAYTNNEATANPNQPNPRPKTSVKVWWAL
jgi:hypothetical protein